MSAPQAVPQCGRARVEPVDRSLQTDARAEPARPDVGTASGASVRTRPRSSAGVGGAAGAALFDPVDDGAAACLEALLDAAEALVDAAPAGADQVDEEREVVDPPVPLGEQVALEPLESPD